MCVKLRNDNDVMFFSTLISLTGVNRTLSDFSDFSFESRYKIGAKIEKRVDVFLATTADTQTVIQKEEVDDYIWLRYDAAVQTLKFDNDKEILEQAHAHMMSMFGDNEGENTEHD